MKFLNPPKKFPKNSSDLRCGKFFFVWPAFSSSSSKYASGTNFSDYFQISTHLCRLDSLNRTKLSLYIKTGKWIVYLSAALSTCHRFESPKGVFDIQNVSLKKLIPAAHLFLSCGSKFFCWAENECMQRGGGRYFLWVTT